LPSSLPSNVLNRTGSRKQPWQNDGETMFNVQRRMADWDSARAEA